MGFLAVNKQLDLQSFLTALGRCDARLQGWYETRRPAGYVLVRAVSFHHMDTLINTRLLDVRLKSVFELSGLVLILWGAWRMLRRAGP